MDLYFYKWKKMLNFAAENKLHLKMLKQTTLKLTCTLFLLIIGLAAQAENYPYRSDYLWLTIPDHADWLYKVGEKAKVEVTFCLYGIPQDVEVSYEIGPDMMPATSTGKVKLKNGRAVIDMGTMKKPGFLDLRLTIEGDQTTPPSAPLLLRRGKRRLGINQRDGNGRRLCGVSAGEREG